MIRSLLLLLPLALATSPAAAGADDGQRWPAEPDVRVDIEIIAGEIEIVGWERNEVRMRARGKGRRAVYVDASPDWITIRAPDVRAEAPARGVEVKLRIDMPAGGRVRAKTINGPIEVKGIRGSITVQTANGEIDVEGSPREAKLKTLSSDIEVSGHPARVEARAVSGSIEIEGVVEEVTANTMSGSIEVEESGPLRRVDLRTFSGSIEFEGSLSPDARAHFETHSGSIELELPEETSAQFDVQTLSGEIESELRGAHSKHSGGLGRRLHFRVGEGLGLVTIETLSGSVKIETED